jgi:calmodulin
MADLPEDTIAEYQEAFALFDKDGNGHIEAKELAAVLTALGQSPSEEDIAKMIAEVDADANGSLEFPEFLQMMSSRMNVKNNDEEIQEAFKVFDLDGSGFITATTLGKAMKSLNEKFEPAELDQLIKITGTDGKVSYNQFKNMMTSR